MIKLQFISAGILLLGIVSSIWGIAASKNVYIEYGLLCGVAGITVYAISFIMGSTSKRYENSIK